MPTIKQWIAIGAFVAFVLIPVCWKFWRGWDRPSQAAKEEMARRKRERDIKEAFIREEAKQREQERLEAEREIALRKAQAPPPVQKTVLTSAFGSLGEIKAPTEDVSELVEDLDVEEIEESVIPEAAPVAVQIQAPEAPVAPEVETPQAADAVDWSEATEGDDWSDIGWS